LIKNKDEIIKQIGYDEHSKNVLENLFTFLVNNNIVDELKIVETGDNNIILKEDRYVWSDDGKYIRFNIDTNNRGYNSSGYNEIMNRDIETLIKLLKKNEIVKKMISEFKQNINQKIELYTKHTEKVGDIVSEYLFLVDL